MAGGATARVRSTNDHLTADGWGWRASAMGQPLLGLLRSPFTTSVDLGACGERVNEDPTWPWIESVPGSIPDKPVFVDGEGPSAARAQVWPSAYQVLVAHEFFERLSD